MSKQIDNIFKHSDGTSLVCEMKAQKNKLFPDKHKKKKGGDYDKEILEGGNYGFEYPIEKLEIDKFYDGESSQYDDFSVADQWPDDEAIDYDKEMLEEDGTLGYLSAESENPEKPKRVLSEHSDIRTDRVDLEQRRAKEKDMQDRLRALMGNRNNRGDAKSQKQQQPAPSTVQSENTQTSQDEADRIDLALAIAEDFTKREGVKIVGGAIHLYNGTFYVKLAEEDAHRMIFRRYRSEISRASPVSIVKNVVNLLRISGDEDIGEFPVNANKIFFPNGTLEVDSGEFRENKRKDLASSALGIEYDERRWEMPHTKRFLKTIADGDNELYERILQAIGYILSNDIKAKSFFYLEGVGDAGKSRFCDLLALFFPAIGPNAVSRIALQDLGKKFALGNLANTKLNISEDLPDSPLSPTTVSKIKMLSDSNRLEAEAKYVQAFTFKPLCKFLFASNNPLRLKEYDAAFINRVVYIPFKKSIPKDKQDKNILEKMQGELPALFNRAFAAYKRLVSDGYVWAGSDNFKPDISIVNSGIVIDKERIVRRFVSECCEFEEDAISSTEELKDAYERFCYQYNHTPIVGDRFSRELLAVLPDIVKRIKIGNQRRGFRGIKLKNTLGWIVNSNDKNDCHDVYEGAESI